MSESRYYYLWNIGCQMNRSDAYRVGEQLEQRGFRPTRAPEQADILVLNTCVVRQSAEDRVIGRLSSLSSLKKHPLERVLAVMGCFVGDVSELERRYPHVDAWLQPSDIDGVATLADQWLARHGQRGTDSNIITPPEVSDLVPISYGCDHHCTYCIVTIRRGPQRSRPIAEIVADVAHLVDGGAREITLLGQNVDAYGQDLSDTPERPDLGDVLEAVQGIEGLERIRFLTSHPRDMTQRIIDRVAALPKVCPCWELAVQSGDDAVLRRMARGYTIERFLDLVGRIRKATPQSAINTDIIVGFCGETEAEFANTMALLRETRFDVVHVAAYSVRRTTPAAKWVDDVPQAIKDARRAAVEQLQESIATEINATNLGQEVEILVDGQQKGRWRGRTRQGKLVFFESEEDWLGRLAIVRIDWTGPWSMIGTVVGDARAPYPRS